MDILNQRYALVGGQMSCASLRPLSPREPLILALHGGPGLSGDHLQPFLARLAETVSLNAALLDLPNHGHSVVEQASLPLTYPDCLRYLDSAIRELSAQCGTIILFGQSFGARAALDLLATSSIDFNGAILTGMPVRLAPSARFKAKCDRLGLEPWAGGADIEGAFARNWRKILPLYTVDPLPAEDFERLATGTRWAGNEIMAEDVPSLKRSFPGLMKRPVATRILFVQGEKDSVLPDGNDEELRRVVPTATLQVIPDAGHFVMLEKPEAALSVMADFVRRLGVTGA